MHFEKDEMKREYESNENSFKQLIVKIVSQIIILFYDPQFYKMVNCNVQRYLFIGFVLAFTVLCLIVHYIDVVLWLHSTIIKLWRSELQKI